MINFINFSNYRINFCKVNVDNAIEITREQFKKLAEDAGICGEQTSFQIEFCNLTGRIKENDFCFPCSDAGEPNEYGYYWYPHHIAISKEGKFYIEKIEKF